jgi:hypothetical protein
LVRTCAFIEAIDAPKTKLSNNFFIRLILMI